MCKLHAISTHALSISSSSPWIIDLGASTHMTKTPNLLSSCLLIIYNSWPCCTPSHGTTITTPSLPPTQVLYIPRFPTNLLFISIIMCAMVYFVTNFSFHCTF